jgi:hypothetical protein
MTSCPGYLDLSSGVRIELRQRPDGWSGLGTVSLDGFPLRHARLPHACEVRTPDGWLMGSWKAELEAGRDGGYDLRLRPTRRRAVPMEWMLHTVRARQQIADDLEVGDPNADGELRCELRPVERSVGGARFRGFSYRWRWASERSPLYRLLDRGSWEPGGSLIGNQFWSRNSFAPQIARFTGLGDTYSSEWYLPGIANPNIFQFLPLQTHLQGFTMTAGAAGTLFTWSPQVAHIRSYFEKRAGGDEMLHLHDLCGDLGNNFDAAPIEVLWAPGSRDRIANANLYEAFRELVAETLHPQVGMEREYARTYCIAEEWGDADLAHYATNGVPKIAAAGAELIGLANHFAHNMNVYGISNMCCTLDYQWPDPATKAGVKAVVEAAKARGLRVQMWGNTALSSLTQMCGMRNGRPKRVDFWQAPGGGVLPVLKKAAHPWVCNPTGWVENDHYNPVFMLLNLRDPDIRTYWNQSWKAAHDEVGIEGMFLDSAFNLSSDKFSFRCCECGTGNGATIDQLGMLGRSRPAVEAPQAVESQYLAHLTLMAEMQRYGVCYTGEDLGVFGAHRTGPGVTAKLDNLFLWNEVYGSWSGAAVAAAGCDPADVFFQGLAYRQPWQLAWSPKKDRVLLSESPEGDEAPTPEQVAGYGAFNRMNKRMRNRSILPDGSGVVYRPAPGEWVLWSFADGSLPVEQGQQVVDVLSGAVLPAGERCAKRNRVYHGSRL